MKVGVIEVSEIPERVTERRGRRKWDVVLDAVMSGKAAVIDAEAAANYRDEHAFRSAIRVAAERRGIRVSVKKDSEDGVFYVWQQPDERLDG